MSVSMVGIMLYNQKLQYLEDIKTLDFSTAFWMFGHNIINLPRVPKLGIDDVCFTIN